MHHLLNVSCGHSHMRGGLSSPWKGVVNDRYGSIGRCGAQLLDACPASGGGVRHILIVGKARVIGSHECARWSQRLDVRKLEPSGVA